MDGPGTTDMTRADESQADLWLDSWRDGTLTEEDAQTFAQQLATDESLRRRVVQLLVLDGDLRQLHQPVDAEQLVHGCQAAIDAKNNEELFLMVFRKRQAAVDAARQVPQQEQAGGPPQVAPQPRPVLQGRSWRRPGVYGAIGLAAAAGLAFAVLGPPDPGPALATIQLPVKGVKLVLQTHREAAAEGMELRAGDSVVTDANETRIAYAGGPVVALGTTSRATVMAPPADEMPSGARSNGTKADGTRAKATRVVSLEAGSLTANLDGTQGPVAPLRVLTPHTSMEASDADFTVMLGEQTEVEVWSGTLYVLGPAAGLRTPVVGGQLAVVGTHGTPQVMWERGVSGSGPGGQLSAAGAPPSEDVVAAEARALLLDPSDLSKHDLLALKAGTAGTTDAVGVNLARALHTGRGPVLDWDNKIREIGSSRWQFGEDGITQPLMAEDGGWAQESYKKGVLSMLQVTVNEPKSFRARARFHLREGAADGDWSVGVTIFFNRLRLFNCHYMHHVDGSVYSLEAFGEDPKESPAFLGQREVLTRVAPISPTNTYWIEFQGIRIEDGLDKTRCQIWPEGGIPTPDNYLEHDVEMDGDLRKLALRTFRASATFDQVEVVPLDVDTPAP